MRKITAFTLGSVTAFTVGLSIVPVEFGHIIDWLAPLFGESLRVLLSMLFILFGNPFKFTTLALMWAVIGLLCGLIVRKITGSLISAWLVYGITFFVALVSALGIVEVVLDLGILQRPESLLALMPPIPPGVSLNTILNAPIIGYLFKTLQETSLSSMGSPTEIISPLASAVALNVLKNVLILLVSSLIGCEAGQIIERLVLPKIAGKISANRTPGGSHPLLGSGGIVRFLTRKLRTPQRLLSSVSILTVLVFSTLAASVTTLENGSSEPYYAEGLFCFATPDGTAYVAAAFIDSEAVLPEIDLSDSAFENALLGLLISHDTRADALPPILTSPEMLSGILPPDIPSEFLENLTRYYAVVPPTVLILAYLDVPEGTARGRADSVAEAFSSAFGASLSYLASFSQSFEISGELHEVKIFVYQSSDVLSDVAPRIMGVLPVARGGLAVPINSAYLSGILSPGSTPISSNGTVMVVGFFSSSAALDLFREVEDFPSEFIGMIVPNTTEPTVTVGLFSYWLDRLHSSPLQHTFNITSLLNLTEPLQFSPEATISVLSTVVPNATITDGKITSQTPIVSLILSANLTDPRLEPVREAIQNLNLTRNVTIKEVPKGSTISAEDLTLSFTQILPMEMDVEKMITLSEVSPGQAVDVTVTITNRDDTPAENVTLDDRLLLAYYGAAASIEVKDGNLTTTWDQIPANSSVTHRYTIVLKKEGLYTIPYAKVSYNYMNLTFTARSRNRYIRVRGPSAPSLLITGIPKAWGTLTRMIDRVPGLEGMGSVIVSSITLAIVGLIGFNEYRNIRRWLKARRERRALDAFPLGTP